MCESECCNSLKINYLLWRWQEVIMMSTLLSRWSRYSPSPYLRDVSVMPYGRAASDQQAKEMRSLLGRPLRLLTNWLSRRIYLLSLATTMMDNFKPSKCFRTARFSLFLLPYIFVTNGMLCDTTVSCHGIKRWRLATVHQAQSHIFLLKNWLTCLPRILKKHKKSRYLLLFLHILSSL